MKCPNRGAAELVHGIRELPYTFKGESTVLPKVEGDFCPVCGEGIFDAAQSRRLSGLMPEFNRGSPMINGLLVLSLLCLAGCAMVDPVAPWQKGRLAKPEMGFNGDYSDSYAEHVYASREATAGGNKVGGGGCGCN